MSLLRLRHLWTVCVLCRVKAVQAVALQARRRTVMMMMYQTWLRPLMKGREHAADASIPAVAATAH